MPPATSLIKTNNRAGAPNLRHNARKSNEKVEQVMKLKTAFIGAAAASLSGDNRRWLQVMPEHPGFHGPLPRRAVAAGRSRPNGRRGLTPSFSHRPWRDPVGFEGRAAGRRQPPRPEPWHRTGVRPSLKL